MLHLHKRRKRIMDTDESTFRAREPVDDQNCGLHPLLVWIPLTQTYGFSWKIMPDLPLTPIWTIRSVSFRRNERKSQLFLSYFNVQICEQTGVCYICSWLLFEKLITFCTKQYDNLVMLKIWFKPVFGCKTYFILSVFKNFWRNRYELCQIILFCYIYDYLFLDELTSIFIYLFIA